MVNKRYQQHRAEDQAETQKTLDKVVKGMGLSGAEDKEGNQRFIEFLRDQHGDIATEFMLESDSVVTIAATFQAGGVVLIAGTGSSCRLLKSDGTIYGVGGWGHQIGDGGSAYWIARRIIQYIFDEEDGLTASPYPTAKVKQLLLDFFKLDDKIGILKHLYTYFDKSLIASFTSCVIKEASNDPLVRHVLNEAGESLGQHVRAISRHFDEAMFDDVPIVLVGSVWQSWEIMKNGFIKALKNSNCRIKQVTLYTLIETPALGAALLVAKKLNKSIKYQQRPNVFEVLKL